MPNRPAQPDEVDSLARRALQVGLRTALAITGDREEASDVAQEVALVACRRRNQLRTTDKFDAWVHRIAVRESYRALKRQRVRDRVLVAATGNGDFPSAAEDPMADREAYELLSALPQRERAAMVLRYVHDLSDAQIAAALRCRTGTVRSLLARGRDRLRSERVEKVSSSMLEGVVP